MRRSRLLYRRPAIRDRRLSVALTPMCRPYVLLYRRPTMAISRRLWLCFLHCETQIRTTRLRRKYIERTKRAVGLAIGAVSGWPSLLYLASNGALWSAHSIVFGKHFLLIV